jgi:hypothetical protein
MGCKMFENSPPRCVGKGIVLEQSAPISVFLMFVRLEWHEPGVKERGLESMGCKMFENSPPMCVGKGILLEQSAPISVVLIVCPT